MSRSKPLSSLPPSAQSPCVRNCCLDQEDVCLGCGRTLEEIRNWSQYSAQEREQVLAAAQRRRKHFPDWTR
ncbi:MAG: DUF1289 domain-containing protein [Pseudomonadota bacterium]|nr:DUF1289 domain-containing protein [Pseudomonadota bacterium]